MIEFKNVSKSFITKEKTVNAVQNVSLNVEHKDIFGIIGFSGAGKSTLIRLVNLLETPSEGNVFVKGVDISTLPKKELRELRQEIGMIFQNFNLFNSRTVAKNIAYPLQLTKTPNEVIRKRVEELLAFVGLEDRADAYPEQLSGGQKQRVGIARALATSPKILICDEATSALDPNTTSDILKLLEKINQELDVTILLITHEMHVIQSICNKVAVMENGSVIEQGSVFETFTEPTHQTTKNFIRATEKDLPSKELLNEWRGDSNAVLYRILFKGDSAGSPIISQATRKHDVDFNIIYGSIQELQNKFFGNLVITFIGEEENIRNVLTELNSIVDVERVIIDES